MTFMHWELVEISDDLICAGKGFEYAMPIGSMEFDYSTMLHFFMISFFLLSD